MENNVNNIIQPLSEGLICDNPNCDFEDMSIKFSDYKNWINKPCPKCGDNLLTEEDYNEATKLINTVNLINSLTKEELAILESLVDIEKLKVTDLLKDLVNVELSDISKDKVKVTIGTHKGLKIKSIEKWKE